jgi:hypothetical protein
MSTTSLAQHQVCGSAPEWDVKSENQEKIKGDLQGKAQALSKYIGSADLTGQIQTERQTIYRTTDQSEARRQDAYLAFMFCVLIMDDKTLSTPEKIKAINEFKRPISSKVNEDNVMAAKLRSAFNHNGFGNVVLGDTLAPRSDRATFTTEKNDFISGDYLSYLYKTKHDFIWQHVYLNEFGFIEAMKFHYLTEFGFTLEKATEFKRVFEVILSELSVTPVYYSRKKTRENEGCSCSGCRPSETNAELVRDFIESEESNTIRVGAISMKYLKEKRERMYIDLPGKPCKPGTGVIPRGGPDESANIWVYKYQK